ncbi:MULTISPECIES: CBS domain-containing protein [unclassified Haloferax]|uniref:CBS domain-containing protein n=1 Tax=unclassified Haloferax TaxID=2625095 RepID=UPI0002B227D0|nr:MULTISPECIES: CBS domain-containing protein [unclassified Haloferax]ELZ55538.1 inosine-5-monophosphate dehydrogenase-like protein [Haloferax sp. ATCC BAA-646]ELZ67482.1 inosine-5-monophosphate dehydrogenase-like protein [Haloferax sp. ATCC BAA-645]ELZ67923.1 inosine-5-monophosphate dehydrogenase-like protein [Haloferax sp. ATCC BAA-644]
MRVDDIMTEEVATVELGSSVADCAKTMLREGAGSVVVMANGGPAGIVTESDALRAGVASGKPLSAVPTRAVMSSPIKWIRPDSTTRVAAEKMRETRVKKLVVVDGSEMVGIVTATDIAFHLSDVARGVGQMIELKDKWESDRRFR